MNRPSPLPPASEPQCSVKIDGLSRRSFLSGASCITVAAFASQFWHPSMAAAADAAASDDNTVIVIFLRGGVDGLRTMVPTTTALGAADLAAARPALVPGASSLLPLSGSAGWALNGSMKPLLPYWASGELAFVPAVSVPGLSRSHFDAQRLIETGGMPTSSTGWMNNTLARIGSGGFTAVSDGGPTPLGLAGVLPTLGLDSLADYQFVPSNGTIAANQTAIRSMYSRGPAVAFNAVSGALDALSVTTPLQAKTAAQNGAVYPNTTLSTSLKDLATLLRGELGMKIATVDVNGWDTHTNETSVLDALLASTASSLAAFMQDLGSERRKRVTVLVMSEFGRRVAQNGTGGTDHGHGSLMWALGGGLRRSGVFGTWGGLGADALDQGDVPFTNNAFDVLGETLTQRLNVGSLSTILPNHSYAPLGMFA